MNNSCL